MSSHTLVFPAAFIRPDPTLWSPSSTHALPQALAAAARVRLCLDEGEATTRTRGALVKVDRDKLSQVLTTMFSIAIKSSTEGAEVTVFAAIARDHSNGSSTPVFRIEVKDPGTPANQVLHYLHAY